MKDNRKSGPAQDWQRLRLWQIQPIRDVMLLGAIALVLYLGYHLRIVTVPILLALALAYLFEPLVKKVTSKTKMISRPGMAVGIIVLAGVVVIVPAVLGIGFAVVQGASTAASIAANTSNLITSVEGTDAKKQEAAFRDLKGEVWKSASIRLRKLKLEVDAHNASPPPVPAPEAPTPSGEQPSSEEHSQHPEPRAIETKKDLYRVIEMGISALKDNAAAIGKAVGQQAIGTGTEAFAVALRTLGSIGMIAFQGFLTAFFFFFFCTGWGKVLSFWESLIPERKKNRVILLVEKMDRVIAGFIRGRLLICFVLMIVITAAYFGIGVPVPLILGPIVALLFLIPFTHWIGALLVMISMWLEPSSVEWQGKWWWVVFAPIGVNLVCQVLDDYLLTPRIQGKNTDLNMPSILFASIAGGALAGFYGLLIAIPAAACIKIMLKDVFWPKFEGWAKGKEKDFLPIAHEDTHLK